MGYRTVNLTFHRIGAPERPLKPDEALGWLDHDQFESASDWPPVVA
jgi:hypothetical protein